MASPMPREAPVMNRVLPASDIDGFLTILRTTTVAVSCPRKRASSTRSLCGRGSGSPAFAGDDAEYASLLPSQEGLEGGARLGRAELGLEQLGFLVDPGDHIGGRAAQQTAGGGERLRG